MNTVEHQIICYIKFLCFLQGRTNLRKDHVEKIDRENCPVSSSEKTKLIASVVVDKIMKQFYYFVLTVKVEKTS